MSSKRWSEPYRDEVANRLVKLNEQTENCFEDAPETRQERGTEIRESADATHLDENDVPKTEFQTANNIEE